MGNAGWRNWSGLQRCQPREVIHPRASEELAAAVARARAAGLRIRVAGAGHSFTDAVCTADVLVVLDRMRSIVEVDPGRGRLRGQGGCTLGEVGAELDRHGLALRNLGDIDRQTVAGAVATGTHGTGERLPSLAEEVTAIELIDGEGRRRQCSAACGAQEFRAAQVSLGALGIFTELTLACEPSFHLRMVERPRPVDELLDQLSELTGSHEHFEAFIFPYAERALTRSADRTDAPTMPRRPVREWVEEVLVSNRLFEALLATGRAAPPLVPALNRLAAAATRSSERVRPSHAALASRRLMRFVEMEWLLPATMAATAVREVRGLIRRQHLRVNMPIELRFVAADRALMSPAYGRPSCCLAVHAYRGMSWQPFFRAVERVLWDLGGRPHWGKLHFQTFETLRPRYPEWDAFQAVRAQFDPHGRFRNAYTDRVLGLPKS